VANLSSRFGFFLASAVLIGIPSSVFAQIPGRATVRYRNQEFPLYPQELEAPQNLPSPFLAEDGTEILVVELTNGRLALMPVTVEHGEPLVYSTRIEDLYGKDNQLAVDAGDFPILARTGLHSEAELDAKGMITGFPLSLITYIGRPGCFSQAGFLAEDEDILSVLKGDNRLVRRLGLTNPEMARPLFHTWNLILHEMKTREVARYWDDVAHIRYNGRQVLLTAEGGRGWQISIFQDETKGRFNLDVVSPLSEAERAFFRERYPGLTRAQLGDLEERLSHIHFSEMAPYYIMQYGFYEGHTKWRADPIAIAFVFGLRSLEEIEEAFPGTLDEVLTAHFVGGGQARGPACGPSVGSSRTIPSPWPHLRGPEREGLHIRERTGCPYRRIPRPKPISQRPEMLWGSRLSSL
jgi:hypothetical protein